jgi:alkaline phosphatase D
VSQTTKTLTRRQVVGAGLAGSTALLLPSPIAHAARRRKTLEIARTATFPSGVASGLPTKRGITLWTQADGLERRSRLVVEIAKDAGFRRVVKRQGVLATPEHGFTAKTRVSGKGLKAGEEYFYRFATRDTSSPVGRFRTARPADSMEPLRIGFFSCQLYTEGYYTAHAALAKEDCDIVVCLGDYMYEGNGSGVREDASSKGENGECELLEDYRAKYRLYRSDPNLQAVHASAAFLATWDDHEVENNHAGSTPGTTSDRRISYEERKRNAYAAWFEQMPTERFRTDADRIYRSVRLGGLAEILMLDLRQHRDEQACDDTPAVPCPESSDPGRTLMGARQEAWIKERLRASTAAWKVLGSSVEMMAWDHAPGFALNPDGWDGYQAERRELLEHIRKHGIEDVTVLTGDIHTFVAGDVTNDGRASGTPVATEFVGGSITSGAVGGPLGEAIAANQATNPHWRYVNFARRGYGVLDLSAKEAQVVFRSPTSITEPEAPVETLASFAVERGTPRVERTA